MVRFTLGELEIFGIVTFCFCLILGGFPNLWAGGGSDKVSRENLILWFEVTKHCVAPMIATLQSHPHVGLFSLLRISVPRFQVEILTKENLV